MRRSLALVLLLGVCACESAHEMADLDGAAPDAGPTDGGRFALPPICTTASSTVDLAIGSGVVCRLDVSGQLWCWGHNEQGQVTPGGGTWVEPLPVPYAGLSDVTSIAIYGGGACVTHRDGGVSCWGDNEGGRVGDGTMERRLAPVRVEGVHDAVAVVTGGELSCARESGGRWLCWGRSTLLETLLGHVRGPFLHAREVPALAGAREVVLGAWIAGLWDDGTVRAVREETPWGEVAGIDDAIDVTPAGSSLCIAHRSGVVDCYGGIWDQPATLTRVEGLDHVRALVPSGGSFQLCAIRDDRSLWCFATATYMAVPGPVTMGNDIEHAALGDFVCATRCSGEVVCNGAWIEGTNGDGRSGAVPTDVEGIASAVEIDDHCALLDDGTVTCWDPGRRRGANGASCRDASFWQESAGTRVVLLSDGCAVHGDGSVRTIRDTWLQIGDEVLPPSVPGPIAQIARVTDEIPMARTTDGRLFYWNSPTGVTEIPVPGVAAEIGHDAVRTTDGHVYDLECFAFFGPTACAVRAAWPDVDDAEAIWQSFYADCIRRRSGEVWCRFGASADAGLFPALGITAPSGQGLVHVPSLDGARQMVLSGETFCARDGAGAVDCWGMPGHARLGTNDRSLDHWRPIESGATDLAHGLANYCALVGGHVRCWGEVRWQSSPEDCVPPLDHTVTVP